MPYQQRLGYTAQSEGFDCVNIPPMLQTDNMELRRKTNKNSEYCTAFEIFNSKLI